MPHIVNNAITVKFVIQKTDTPLLASDYDILLVDAFNNATYTDDAITGYVAPNEEFRGYLEYTFTPTIVGIYRLYLTTNAGLGGGGGSWANGDQAGTIFFTINSGPGFQIGENVDTLSPFRFNIMTVDANVTSTSFDFSSGGTYEVQVSDTLFGSSSETNATVTSISTGVPGHFVLEARRFSILEAAPIFIPATTDVAAHTIP